MHRSHCTVRFEIQTFEKNHFISIESILTGGNIIYSGKSREFLEIKNNFIVNNKLESTDLLNFGNFLETIGVIQMFHERVGTDAEDEDATLI